MIQFKFFFSAFILFLVYIYREREHTGHQLRDLKAEEILSGTYNLFDKTGKNIS